MRLNYKPNFKNRPPHIIKENGYFFLTSRTVDGQWYLQPDKYKDILLRIIKEKSVKFNFPLIAFVILYNHYHLIVNIKEAGVLSKFMNEINGASSREINKADHVIERKIWWNYFDKFLAGEKDFYIHLNYIHQNPIKHGVIKDLKYKFSSYRAWQKKRGKEFLEDCFRKYPIVDFVVFGDEF